MISVLINTYNEEANLATALPSVVDWADEIVVVDMYSDDATRDIAQRFGARVVLHERMDFVEPARAFGIEHCSGDWIAILDADEVVPPRLAATLLSVAEGDTTDIVIIQFRNYLLGAPLNGGGWGPRQDPHARFFRRNKLAFHHRIHSRPTPAPDARILRLPPDDGLMVLHFNYVSASHVIQKLNRYTNIEAAQRLARGVTPGAAGTAARAAKAFLNRYFRLGGFRDGWRGLFLCAAMAFYEFAIAAKVLELQLNADEDSVTRAYRAIAAGLRCPSKAAAAPDETERCAAAAPKLNRDRDVYDD